MAVPTGFGISNPEAGKNVINRTRSCQTSPKDLTDKDGKIIDQVTTGGYEETKQEVYADDPSAFTNEAVDGQTGAEVVTACELVENAGDWAKASRTKRKLLSPRTVTP